MAPATQVAATGTPADPYPMAFGGPPAVWLDPYAEYPYSPSQGSEPAPEGGEGGEYSPPRTLRGGSIPPPVLWKGQGGLEMDSTRSPKKARRC